MKPVQKSIEFFFRKKWLGLIVVIALFYGIGISTVYRGAIGLKQRTDLGVFFKAAEMVHIGRANHIYEIENSRHWHYVYSPLLAILLAPATDIPFVASVILFFSFSLFCLWATFLVSAKFTEDARGAPWKIALSAIFCLPIFMNILTRGQMGLIMLAAQAAIFLFYLKGWKILTGFLLAFAVALKISPLAVLFFFFLFKKEWKLLLVFLLSGFFFLIVYPSLTIGSQQNWELLKIWRGLMAEGSSILAYKSYLWRELFTPFADDNQSFYAVITRFVWPDQNAFIAHPSNWVRWSSTLLGGLGLFSLFLKRKPAGAFPVPATKRAGLLAEYSLYPVLMLVFSPVTQIHHYTALYFLYLAGFFMMDNGSPHRRMLLAGIWISAIFFFLGFVIDPLAYWGLPMWGALFLFGVMLFCPERSPQTGT